MPFVIKDPKLIDVSDIRELERWATLLQITTNELRLAVSKVGHMAVMVAAHVGSKVPVPE